MTVIQVPIDESLLGALDALARQRRLPRAELIRRACRRYVSDERRAELDEVYQAGYRRVPEEPGVGLAQVALAGQVLPPETW
jgi:metal-responsive CopG/Arc/MetJ family transcriptional regulator